jgi:hypothetical protein
MLENFAAAVLRQSQVEQQKIRARIVLVRIELVYEMQHFFAVGHNPKIAPNLMLFERFAHKMYVRQIVLGKDYAAWRGNGVHWVVSFRSGCIDRITHRTKHTLSS